MRRILGSTTVLFLCPWLAYANVIGTVRGSQGSLACGGTDKISGFASDGTIQCAADSTGAGGGTFAGVGSCPVNQWARVLNQDAAPTCTQPTFANLSGTATDAQLASNYSGVGACPGGQFVSTLNDNGAPTCGTPVPAALLSCITVVPWSPCASEGVVACTVSGAGCVATTNMTALGQRGMTFTINMDRYTHAKLRYFGALAAAQTGTVTVNLRNYSDSTNDVSTTFNAGTTCADRSSATIDLTAKTGVDVFGIQIGDSVITDDPLLSGVAVEFCTGAF